MKTCEICSRTLTKEQKRFCCRRCRNISAGRVSALRHIPPDKAVLAKKYLLPPLGEGKKLKELAKIFSVSDRTVSVWLKKYGLTENSRARSVYQKAGVPNLKRRIPSPAREELARLYLLPPDGEAKTEDELAALYGVARPTLRRWLNEYGLMQPHSERHSWRTRGKGNPAYVDGNSMTYVRRLLKRQRPNVICNWCGANERIEVHHIDHNRENNNLDNLMWLCKNCNLLEAQAFILRKSGRADFEHKNNQLIIQFKTG